MLKIAIFKGKEIAREKAIVPILDGKYNALELMDFYDEISKEINYDNNRDIEFYCRYIKGD